MADFPQIDRLKNKITVSVQKQTIEYVNKKKVSLEKSLLNLQDTFYTTLVQKGIGVESEPRFGKSKVSGKPWKALDSQYKKNKIKKKNADKFYVYKGALRSALLRSKATTTFGKPLVTTGKFASKGKQLVFSTNSGYKNLSGQFVGGKLTNFSVGLFVDIYPKVKEPISKGRINEYNYFSTKTAYKLRAWRGEKDRPLIVDFMNWWLETKAKSLVKRSFRR